jgi:hypothetical protein
MIQPSHPISEITVMTDVRDFTNIWFVQIGVRSNLSSFCFWCDCGFAGVLQVKGCYPLAKLAGLASTSISNAGRSRYLRLYEAPILQH